MADYLRPVCAIFLPHTGCYLGGKLFKKEALTWYQHLKQPSFSPPNWLKTSCLTTAYGCMGYGSYLIWRDCGGFEGDGALPLACYGANIVLIWSSNPLLFKTKNLGVGMISKLSILGATIATVVTFKNVNSTAGYLVLPFLGWVCYTSLISYRMWRNN